MSRVDDTFKLRDFNGYFRMALHEIGHSMGLADNNARRGTSVMNKFSEDDHKLKEQGGLRDDPLNWIANEVTECDIKAVKRSRGRIR